MVLVMAYVCQHARMGVNLAVRGARVVAKKGVQLSVPRHAVEIAKELGVT